MNCPRCQNVVLREREREGLLIDICETCRGVWLDRGELEKLISRATREFDESNSRFEDTPARGIRYHDHSDHRQHPKKKRGWIHSLGEIFD